jgi:4,5-dihydroxyphthalate decarboxylase
MSKLALSVAVGNYDRTRALIDGSVRIDGVDAAVMTLPPEEIFFRAFRHAEFDVCELSLSSFVLKLVQGDCPYVGVPAFLSRAFRHNAIYVRTDRISSPADLKGRRLGVPEYQLTAIVWARAILEDDHGVAPADVIWVRGGIMQPGRPEKIGVQLPPGIRLESAPEGETISALLDRGEIDAFIAPRPPACLGNPNVGWLFPDPAASAADYYRRTGIFPIMHLVGVRRTLTDAHPWLPVAVLNAFAEAKIAALGELGDTSSPKVTLPFVEEQLKAARALMGQDFWPYGVDANRGTLTTFLRHHHRQGLSARLLHMDEIFHPATYETAKI